MRDSERILAVSQQAFEQVINGGRGLRIWSGGTMRLDGSETLLIHQRQLLDADNEAAVVLGAEEPGHWPLALPDPELPIVLFGRQGTVVSMATNDARRFSRVRIVGPGLPEVVVDSSTRDPESQRESDWGEYYSRTRGAMGGDAFDRLSNLRIAVVGVGRSGTILAAMLARAGVSELSLIDPDRLEPHNLGEVPLLSPRVIGQPKVDAVSDRLREETLRPDIEIRTRHESAISLSSLYVMKRADMIATCADGPLARVVASFLAAIYLKPLLDVGTGILGPQHAGVRLQPFEVHGARAERTTDRIMGADIRWMMPGHCLHCFGGIAAMERLAAEMEASDRRAASSPAETSWQRQRAGSLASLNGLAVGFGMRLLEDFLAARIEGTRWIHFEYDNEGRPMIENRTPPSLRVPGCPICRLAGRGDAALTHWSELAEQLAP